MMKILIFLTACAVIYVQGRDFKNPPRDLSSELMSREDDDIITFDDVKKPLRDHKKRVQPPKPKDSDEVHFNPKFDQHVDRFFTRPSSEELKAYEDKVNDQRPKPQRPFDIMGPKPKKPINPANMEQRPIETMDETDQRLVLTAMGQMFLQDMDRDDEVADSSMESGERRFPPNNNFDNRFNQDYENPFVIHEFVPAEPPAKIESRNNNNGNVNVKVNSVKIQSTLVGLKLDDKDKDKKKHDDHKEERDLIDKKREMFRDSAEPAPIHTEFVPMSSSQYVYLNMNLPDAVVLVGILAVLVFLIRKTYAKCFEKAPPLPTQAAPSLPPTYTPSSSVVETITKKIAPQ